MKIPEFSTLRDLFTYSTTNFKNNTCFSYVNGDSYTYGEFGTKTEEISEVLTKYGISSGDKVAILSQNMPNWPVAYFATTAYGRVVVPMLPDFSEHEIRNVIEHSESKALFVSKRLIYKVGKDLLDKMEVVICTDDNQVIRANESAVKGEIKIPQEEDLASIIYTSGTTGNSKGVMLTQRNLSKHLYAASLLRPGYEWDIWLSLLPLSHTLECSLCMMLPMVSGSSVYYIEKAPTPTILLKALKDVRPTTILSVPMIIEKIYKNTIYPKFNSSPIVKAIYKTTLGRKLLHKVAGKKLMETFGGRLRFFGIGGAKLDGVVERFLYEAKFPYAIGYGLTETSPLLAGAIPDNVKWQSTGPAVHGVTLRIDNPNPETGEGEIVAKGPNIMPGYYKNPDATEQAFTKDGWFRTKDLGIIDQEGRLYIKGRLTNMILGPSGENIYPEEIESVINGHAMVAESVVTQSKGKLIARVHLNPDKLKALKEATDEAIAAYYEKKEQLVKSFENKKEEFAKTKDELVNSYEEKKEELIQSYDEKRDEFVKAFNEKIEQIKKEISEYVNTRVNKFSKIAAVEDHPEQFEKTATHKIKRYKYTEKQ
ncbi:MAG: AMP-binding protein [Bacteroidales bacterium]|jgi:long-chain acyl-CoA synthetase|nr:AMP-binding protein [Bacteroidales bacterium]